MFLKTKAKMLKTPSTTIEIFYFSTMVNSFLLSSNMPKMIL